MYHLGFRLLGLGLVLVSSLHREVRGESWVRASKRRPTFTFSFHTGCQFRTFAVSQFSLTAIPKDRCYDHEFVIAL